jgi:uncharacterized protein with FMN-binding domain
MSSRDEGRAASGDAPRAPLGGRATQRSRPNLLTLGSAAVLAIYTAGYLRTRDAAERIAGETNRHSPPHVRDAAVHAASSQISVAPSAASVGPDSGARTQLRPNAQPSTPTKKQHRAASTPSPKPQHAADSTTSVVAPTPKAVEPIQLPVDTAPSNVPASPPAVAKSSPPTDTATTAIMHDGIYSGWGTSRHGDIQATVEIKGGRITAAYISQCLTRYSCSWIAALPPQVVTRQSAEVDYVSGATQSTNAFYYAIVEALNKAK